MRNTVISVEHLSKSYQLGQIGANNLYLYCTKTSMEFGQSVINSPYA